MVQSLGDSGTLLVEELVNDLSLLAAKEQLLEAVEGVDEDHVRSPPEVTVLRELALPGTPLATDLEEDPPRTQAVVAAAEQSQDEEEEDEEEEDSDD